MTPFKSWTLTESVERAAFPILMGLYLALNATERRHQDQGFALIQAGVWELLVGILTAFPSIGSTAWGKRMLR